MILLSAMSSSLRRCFFHKQLNGSPLVIELAEFGTVARRRRALGLVLDAVNPGVESLLFPE